MDNLDKIKKRLIYYVALLTVYFLLTLGLAAIFEYYIVSTSKGEIIFSFAMSWQLILFVLELITIAVQAVTLIKVVNSMYAQKISYNKKCRYCSGRICRS